MSFNISVKSRVSGMMILNDNREKIPILENLHNPLTYFCCQRPGVNLAIEMRYGLLPGIAGRCHPYLHVQKRSQFAFLQRNDEGKRCLLHVSRAANRQELCATHAMLLLSAYTHLIR